ncbi:MAG: glycosyltransferase [Phycisphaeraceae bacterium]|nr:MAG: glycosyltransferase [Phycisphaeraceae bacterium]
MPAHAEPKQILFLEKTLMEHRERPFRGVQLHNFILIGDLVRLGHRVVVPAERTWRARFEEAIPAAMPELMDLPNLGSYFGGRLAAHRLRRARFDAMILGNVGRGIAPAVRRLHRRGAAPRAVVIANRTAREGFLRTMRGMPMNVVTVNREIAAGFEGRVNGIVDTYYGIANADDFHPPAAPKPADAPVEFCVLGKLDPEWKGADLAIEAFRAMPEEVRSRCRLQLIAYEHPPETGDERIIAHSWTSPSRIPELLRSMDVLIVPSRGEFETFSQAIVQGMLTGLPIISSDLLVLTEKLDAGGGLIFRSTAELGEHMRTLAVDVDLRRRLGDQARRTARDRYIWSTQRFVERFLFPAEPAPVPDPHPRA